MPLNKETTSHFHILINIYDDLLRNQFSVIVFFLKMLETNVLIIYVS
jgi:hypothetical protein